MTINVLVVSKSVNNCRRIEAALASKNMKIEVEFNYNYTLERLNLFCADIVILELSDINPDSLSLYRNIKKNNASLILISKINTDEAECLVVKNGVDVFIKNPLNIKLLSAYLDSMMIDISKRKEKIKNKIEDSINIGDVKLFKKSMQVHVKGEIFHLSYSEFKLTWLLASKKNNILSREEIHRFIYSKDLPMKSRTIDVMISRLRKKFAGIMHIKSFSSRGYGLSVV